MSAGDAEVTVMDGFDSQPHELPSAGLAPLDPVPDGLRQVDLETVTTAYGSIASLYIETLGSVEQAATEDRDLIARWSDTLPGPALDAGCGPGHWTAFLKARGVEVEGIDATPEFVKHAAHAHPDIRFQVADLREFSLAESSLGGVLAWYSLIHFDPADVPAMLSGFARALRPGGGLLVGFFSGDRRELFDHRVVPGWKWPMSEMADALEAAGFEIVSRHERPAPNGRQHAAIRARRAA